MFVSLFFVTERIIVNKSGWGQLHSLIESELRERNERRPERGTSGEAFEVN